MCNNYVGISCQSEGVSIFYYKSEHFVLHNYIGHSAHSFYVYTTVCIIISDITRVCIAISTCTPNYVCLEYSCTCRLLYSVSDNHIDSFFQIIMASRPVLESISADRKSRVKELDQLASSKHIFQLQLFCVIIGCCVCDVTSNRSVSEICYFLESLFIESAKALLYIQAVLLQIKVSSDKVHSVFGPINGEQYNEFNGHLKFGELIIAICDNLSDEHFKSLRFILRDKYENEVHEDNIPCAEYLFMLLIDKNVINFKNMRSIVSGLRTLQLEILAGKIDAYHGTVAVSQQGTKRCKIIVMILPSCCANNDSAA